MASGKSTLAEELKQKHNTILLTEDYWLSQLYPDEIFDIPGYVKYSDRLKTVLSAHIKSLLAQDVSVILDFPGNTKKQRSWFRDIFEQMDVCHVLHFVDATDEICKSQLKKRNKGKPLGTAFTSDKEFDEITQYFEVPSDIEGFSMVRYKR